MKHVEALFVGSHSPDGKMCAMEAAAYVAGEPWSDRPTCVSPLLGASLRSWNDALRSDADRWDALKPSVLKLQDSYAELVKRMAAVEKRKLVAIVRPLRIAEYEIAEAK